MANCILAFPNQADDATLSSGSWAAALPITNMQSRLLGKVARTSDDAVASTKFDITFTAAVSNRVLALVNHNFSLLALYRIRADDAADFASPIYDSGWLDAWPGVYTVDQVEWEDDNWWTGQYTTDDRAGYTWTLVHDLGSTINARYWRVEIDDTANTDTYVQIGRLFLARGWQPITNMEHGASHGWETQTEVQEALSGAEYFNARTPYRVARFQMNFSYTDGENDAFGNAFEIQRRAGLDQEVLYIYDPDDTLHALRRQFLGRLRQLSPIEFPQVNVHKTAFEIKELI